MKILKIFSWCIYDFGTTVFMMNIVSLAFVQWLDQKFGQGDTYYGIFSSIVYILSLILYPIVGEICDRGWKLLPLFILTILSVIGTFFIGFTNSLIIGGILFIIAYLTYQIALTYYNSLLDDITLPKNFGIVSGLGVAARYIGSIVGLLSLNFFIYASYQDNLPNNLKIFIKEPYSSNKIISLKIEKENINNKNKKLLKILKDKLKLSNKFEFLNKKDYIIIRDKKLKKEYFLKKDRKNTYNVYLETNYSNAFIPTALLYFICTLPIFIFVRTKKKDYINEKFNIKDLLKNTILNLKKIFKDKNTFNLLMAILFGGIPVYGAIHFMSVFLKKIGGVPDTLLLKFLIIGTIFSIIGGVIFGTLLRPIGNKITFMIILIIWVTIILSGSFIHGITIMWIISILAGIGMGGFWATARILVLDIAPPNKQGEYLAFYGVVTVLCGILTSLLWPLGIKIGEVFKFNFVYQRISSFLLGIMGVIGIIFFYKVKFEKNK